MREQPAAVGFFAQGTRHIELFRTRQTRRIRIGTIASLDRRTERQVFRYKISERLPNLD